MAYLKAALPGPAGPAGSAGISRVLPAVAAAAGLVGARTLGRSAGAATIAKIWITANDAVTASDANFRGYTLFVYDAAGNVIGEAGTITTQTIPGGGVGSMVPFGVYEGTLGATLAIPAGGSVVFEDGKGGAGVDLPEHALGVDLV